MNARGLLTDIDTEKVTLFLPSQLPLSLWSTGCMPRLHVIELKLRIAQISDALDQLKQHLCVYSNFVNYKINQVSGPGQKANTRARILLVRFTEKIICCAERYSVSRAALEILDPKGDWQEYFRPLSKSDLQGPNGSSPDDLVPAMSRQSKRLRGTGEDCCQLSWIWTVRHRFPHSNSEGRASVEGSTTTAEADIDGCECCYCYISCFRSESYYQI